MFNTYLIRHICILSVFVSVSVFADEFQWLENIESPESMAWVKRHNERDLPQFVNDPRFLPAQEDALAIILKKDRVPQVSMMGDYVYNFWSEAKNPRGVWRRTKISDFIKAEPKWETLLDIDALAESEGQPWVWQNFICEPGAAQRCMIFLSRGGKDAAEVREFDLESKTFVNGGCFLPEAKTDLVWIDREHLLVGTDFGEDSLTESGYARVLKILVRGESLASAQEVMRIPKESVYVSAYRVSHRAQSQIIIAHAKTFYEQDYYVYKASTQEKYDLTKLAFTEHGELVGLYSGLWLFKLKKDYGIFDANSIVGLDAKDFSSAQLVYKPAPNVSIEKLTITHRSIVIELLENVQSKLIEVWSSGRSWQSRRLAPPANISLVQLESEPSHNIILYSYAGFLQPESMYYSNLANTEVFESLLKTTTASFNANPYVVEQRYASSKDGTKIPYFIIYNKERGIHTAQPTILYGYGGFEISLVPSYLAKQGKLWLDKGGVYVIANIRGGAEFGPAWHQAALLENRQRAYDDFISVAEHLISSKVTTPRKLGIMGRSNGGLLMGVMFTQRPDLFNAVACGVPLLDMLRYHLLLAGASWMGEYGNPDVASDREYLQKYSPYHNIKQGVRYPKIFFQTSTYDDRVHPAHARKMAAKLEKMGYEFYYNESFEGGHSGSANPEEKAFQDALTYTYFYQQLM